MTVDPYSALKLSVYVGLACVVLGFPLALACGWLLARKEFWGKTFLTMLIFLPLSLPPVVTGLLILQFMGRESFLGQIFDMKMAEIQRFQNAILA